MNYLGHVAKPVYFWYEYHCDGKENGHFKKQGRQFEKGRFFVQKASLKKPSQQTHNAKQEVHFSSLPTRRPFMTNLFKGNSKIPPAQQRGRARASDSI